MFPPPFTLLNTDIPIRLRRIRSISPANRALVGNAARTPPALQSVVRVPGRVGPRVEKGDVTGSAAGSGPQRADQVTRLKLSPRNRPRDLGQAHSVIAGRSSVKSHGDEARAVGSVAGAVLVGIRRLHGVWDVLGDPILPTGNDFLTADFAVDGAAAAAATLASDHVGCPRLDVVVGDVAAVSGLVPERIAVDGLSGRLALELDVVALVVCSHNLVAGRWPGATVDAVGLDGVGTDRGNGRGERKS